MSSKHPISLSDIQEAAKRLKGIIRPTVMLNAGWLERQIGSPVSLKPENLQRAGSFKIRGAYNLMSQLSDADRKKGVIAASAGNHAQGVAYSCHLLNIQGTIFMPATTPKQKIKQVELFGKTNVQIILEGDTFDDTYKKAIAFCEANNNVFVHPFDDVKVIAGQGTVGLEILEQLNGTIDYLFVPIGGGGLSAGVSAVFKALSPTTKIIGVEPLGAPSMKTSIAANQNITLDEIDKFVDGAAVKRVGDLNFEICKKNLDYIILVPEGKVCSTILKLYNEEAIVVEPAGALSIAALDFYQDEIKGKKCVCVVSGSNNDITRTEEIKERSLFYEGLKHYFLIQFPQRPGALKDFVTEILGPDDDITFFQFSKKNNRESGPAVVGIELKSTEDLKRIYHNLNQLNFKYEYLNNNQALFTQLIG